MELCLLLTLVLGGTSVATSASFQKTPASSRDALIIAKAIEIYNREPDVTYFKLFESDPDGSLEMPSGPEQLRFTIKETVCVNQMSNQHVDKCDFKDSGTVKDCRATVSSVLGEDIIMVICDPVTAKTPVRRPRQTRKCVRQNNKRVCKENTNPSRPGLFSPLSRPDNTQMI
ncbi:cathelicidin-1-like isoform X1 [Pleurodeles waltl]|uniref:cathelicidin-1-like isoform X1 n=1 Tax=Pleurodeles waltl TaxID=8319 RepID=UPI00370977E3